MNLYKIYYLLDIKIKNNAEALQRTKDNKKIRYLREYNLKATELLSKIKEIISK